jgi:hypothetical protein
MLFEHQPTSTLSYSNDRGMGKSKQPLLNFYFRATILWDFLTEIVCACIINHFII